MKMRILYFFFLSSLYAVSSQGQFETVVEDFGFTDAPFLLEETPEGQVILINDGLGDFSYRNSIVVFTDSGTQAFNQLVGSFIGRGTINDIIFLPDGPVAWLQEGSEFLCTPGFRDLVIYDSSWEQLSSNAIDIPFDTGRNGKFGGVIEGDFILFKDSGITRLGNDGTTIWQEGFLGGNGTPLEVRDMVVMNGDSLLAATQFGLWILDGDGDLIEIVGFKDYTNFRRLELLNEGKLLGLSSAGLQEMDSLILFSSSLEQLDRIGFSDEKVLDLTAWADKVAVLTENQYVYIYDTNLNLEHDFQIQDVAQFNHIALVSDGVVLAGRVQFGLDEPRKGNRAALLKKFSFDGNNVDQVTDVGIINIDQDQGPYSNQSDYYKVFFEDLKFTIQNFGEDVLDNLKINLEFAQIDTVCSNGYQRFSKKFEGLSILPGETVELEWGQLTVTFDEDPTGLLSFCAWTSQPNLKADVNHENDLHCYDFVVDDEEIIADAFFKIHPNPAISSTTVEYQLPAGTTATVSVSDGLGQQVGRYQTDFSTGTLTLPDYPAGLYFVSLQVDGKVLQTEKLVKF